MIRYSLPLTLAAGPLWAHGVHGPVSEAWHAAAHFGASAVLAVIAAAAGIALMRGARRVLQRARDR